MLGHARGQSGVAVRQLASEQRRLGLDRRPEAEPLHAGQRGEGEVGAREPRLEVALLQRAAGLAIGVVEAQRPVQTVAVQCPAEIEEDPAAPCNTPSKLLQCSLRAPYG
jgi:hypothetical protein